MISFVILHYNDIAITNKCIDHLLKMKDIEGHSIILVDNASPNGSGVDLKKQYESSKLVDVILLSKNVGFAKGNDVGYLYAKQKGDMEYIIVMNNDVMIEDVDFIHKLEQFKLNQKAEIVLPEIINKTGKKQNPYRLNPVSTKQIYKMLLQKVVLLTLYSLPVVCNFMIQRHEKKNNQTNDNNYSENCTKMLVPHGSCIIYTKKWIENEEIAFIPDTFMYHEEDILYEYILNKKYTTFFYKDLSVLHMEDVSTSTIAQTKLKKARFYLRNSIKPILVLKKLRKFNDKQKTYTINYDVIKELIDSCKIR